MGWILGLLIVTQTVCIAGWLKWKIATMTLSAYLVIKNYTPPSDAELEECRRYVIRETVESLTGRKSSS